jgi:type VI secretion system FHA domain protein
VEMPFGEAPPGARGVLPLGQILKLAEYTVSAAAVPEVPSQELQQATDPWAVFDRDGHGIASAQEDPFGEWGFEATFGPGPMGGGALDAGKLAPGDLTSFFQGLGLDPATVGALSQGEIEAIGHLVRGLVLGVLELHLTAMGVNREMRSEDRTMVAAKDNNPLKTEWPPETKLRYLFGGRATGVGFVAPERAVRELLVELIAHNKASGAAARAAMESTLKEFAPDVLKARLLGEGTRLFEGARAWDAYVKYYQEQGKDLPKWAQRLLDQYFAQAYLGESLRIRRETPSGKR